MADKSLKKNFGYQAFYQIFVLLLPLFTSPYISRVLGPSSLGIYSYYYSVANYFVLFAMLGVNNYGNRLISSCRKDGKNIISKEFSSLAIVHIIVSAICLVVYVAYSLLIVSDDEQVFATIQGLMIVGALFDINWFFFGLEEFKLTVTRNTVVKVVTVSLIFIFVREQGDLWKYCFIMAGGTAASQIVVWPFLKKYIDFTLPSKEDILKHIKPLFILFIPVLAVSVYKIMDKIMLGQLATKTDVGYYDNAEKIITIFNTVIASFGTVMLPRMNNLFAEGKNSEGLSYIDKSLNYILVFSYAVAFGVGSIADNFSVWFWGNNYAESGRILAILVFTLPFVAFASVIRMQYLIPKREDKAYIISVCGGALVNLTVNILLIPKYSGVGAAIGTLLAEIFVCVFQMYTVRNEVNCMIYVRKSLPYLLSAILMYVTVKSVGLFWDNSSIFLKLICQTTVGAIVYLIPSCLWLQKTTSFFSKLLKNK